MDEENTIVVQAIYTQSPLNEGKFRSIEIVQLSWIPFHPSPSTLRLSL
jgi:hypothetical protein